ncbi:hypothetical protein NSA19_13105 [Actinomyces bowdenii]|nr:hypothetical protein [Actinomyces bowdenii]
MATGWSKLGGSWYYFKGDGAMATGWIQVGGSWYYLGSSGAMMSSTWVGDYYLTDSGAMASGGWALAGGTWYRFHSSGRWLSVYSGTYTCPSHAPIKGNKDSMIYHRPGQRHYDRTKAEECFATGSDAQIAGYRAAKI